MVTKKDVLNALGINMVEERREGFLLGILCGIGAGALLGGISALLLAPKSGAETRRIITKRGKTLVDRARHRVEDAKEDLQDEFSEHPV